MGTGAGVVGDVVAVGAGAVAVPVGSGAEVPVGSGEGLIVGDGPAGGGAAWLLQVTDDDDGRGSHRQRTDADRRSPTTVCLTADRVETVDAVGGRRVRPSGGVAGEAVTPRRRR